MSEKMVSLNSVFYDKPSTWEGIENIRVLVVSSSNPMEALGVKFTLEGKLHITVLPMYKTGDTYTLCESSNIPPVLYKLGSIITSRFASWKASTNAPLQAVFREIRDCEIEVSSVNA